MGWSDIEPGFGNQVALDVDELRHGIFVFQDNVFFPIIDPDFANKSFAAIFSWIRRQFKILIIYIDAEFIILDNIFFLPPSF